MSGEVVCIADWQSYRHYKDRAVDWVKISADLLIDIRFWKLSAELKAQFAALLLLSARFQKDPLQTPALPADPDYLGEISGTKITAKSLSDLVESGLLVYGPVEPASDRGWKSRYIPKPVKEAVLARDKRCLNCGDPARLEVDHVIPVSMPELIDQLLDGNAAHPSNLQVLCRSCNRSKRFSGHGEIAKWVLSPESAALKDALLGIA